MHTFIFHNFFIPRHFKIFPKSLFSFQTSSIQIHNVVHVYFSIFTPYFTPSISSYFHSLYLFLFSLSRSLLHFFNFQICSLSFLFSFFKKRILSPFSKIVPTIFLRRTQVSLHSIIFFKELSISSPSTLTKCTRKR